MSERLDSPRILAAAPQLSVANVVATAEHWRDRFGFEIAGYWGTPPVFAIVQRDGVEVFFSQVATPPARAGRADGPLDAYFHVAAVDALAAELRARGADVLDGPVDRVYLQRELVVRDVNGLVVAFAEDTSGR